jgi:hypothetical protein
LSSDRIDGNFLNVNSLVRTTDRAITWTTLYPFSDTITSVVAGGIDPNTSKQVLLVATATGSGPSSSGSVERSNDGGNTFTPVLHGAATDLVPDPINPMRFYAALPGQGVFRTDDSGSSWHQIDNNIPELTSAYDIKLATTKVTAIILGTNIVFQFTVLFAATASPPPTPTGNGHINAVFQGAISQQGQAIWTNIAQPDLLTHNIPIDIASGHFAIVADPTNANVVYISGYGGNIWRGDANAKSWTFLWNWNNSQPHVDSRHLAFLGTTTLLETDDGGIYALTNPLNPGPSDQWIPLNSDLGVTEIYGVDYDNLNHVILSGQQDNGASDQSAPNAIAWQQVVDADGGFRQVDSISTPGLSFRYAEANGLATFQYQVFDSNNKLVITHNSALVVNGTGGKTIPEIDGSKVPLITPYVLNAVDPQRMLILTQSLYESSDRGDTFNLLADLGPAPYDSDPLVYGGFRPNAFGGEDPYPDLIWVGAGGKLWLRTQGVGPPNLVAGYHGGIPRAIVSDPSNWYTTYVLDGDGKVWETTNGGASWTDMTLSGDRSLTALSHHVSTLAIYQRFGITVLLAGGIGGVFRLLEDNQGKPYWSLYGDGGPLYPVIPSLGQNHLPNVLVTSLHYDAKDDVLVAGTLGRGAWMVSNVSQSVFYNEAISISAYGDKVRMVQAPNDPLRFLIYANNIFVGSAEYSARPHIQFYGFGNNSSLTVDETNGVISNDPILSNIVFSGMPGDKLIVDDSEDPDFSTITVLTGLYVTVNDGKNPAITTNIFYIYLQPGVLTEVDSSGGSIVNVQETQTAEPLTVVCGPGKNPSFGVGITIGEFDLLAEIIAPISINYSQQGSVGVSLTIDAQGHKNPQNNVVVAATSVTGLAPAKISYPEDVGWVIETGSGGDNVTVVSKGLGGPITDTIESNGPDTVQVGDNTNGLFFVRGQLIVRNVSNNSTTSLLLDDAVDKMATKAVITSGEVDWFLAEVQYGPRVSGVTLKGGSGNDTFQVMTVANGVTYSIDGGGGINTLDVSGYGSPLALALTQDGPLGGVKGTAGAGLTFSDIESLLGNTNVPMSVDGSNFSGDFTATLTVAQFRTVGSLKVPGNFTGTLDASSEGSSATPIPAITIQGSMLANAKIKVDFLNTFSVGQDMGGVLKGFGNVQGTDTIKSITIGGKFTPSGMIIAPVLDQAVINQYGGSIQETVPTKDMQLLKITGTMLGTGIVQAGMITTISVGQALAGQVIVTGAIGSLSVGGNLTGRVSAASIGSLTIGANFTGQITVSGTLGNLTIGGSNSGTISAGQVSSLAARHATGGVLLNITQAGVQRELLASLVNPATCKTGPEEEVSYFYDGTTAVPQIFVRILPPEIPPGPCVRFDLSLVVDGLGQFSVARIDSLGANGQPAFADLHDLAVTGNILSSVSPAALHFFGLPAGTPGGVFLPSDNLGDVAAAGNVPAGSIHARSIEAVAFGTETLADGRVISAEQAQARDAATLLAPGTHIVQANGTFLVIFYPPGPCAFFLSTEPQGGDFDDRDVIFVTSPTQFPPQPIRAQVTAAPVPRPNGQPGPAVIQTIALFGDGGSIQTRQEITQAITSTGPLGDLILGSEKGLVANVTAPSIFGNILVHGPIAGTIQTTGQRLDPVTGAVTQVAADIGRLLTNPQGKVIGVTQVRAEDGGITGRIISRRDLISQVIVDGGLSGLVAVQGNIDETNATDKDGHPVRLGGLVVNGGISGQVVVLGTVYADVIDHGGLRGGRIAVKGDILGNLTIDGEIDAGSAVVTGGRVGDATAGTVMEVGEVKGILAAEGSILFKHTPNTMHAAFFGQNLKTADPTSAVAIDAIFQPDVFDQIGLDLKGLGAILSHVAALHVSGGHLVLH